MDTKLTDKQTQFCMQYASHMDIGMAKSFSDIDFPSHPGEKFYVYLLVDPRSSQIFYIGKGKGRRPYGHMAEARSGKLGNTYKHNRIREIWASDEEVSIIYFQVDMKEDEAYGLERSLIKSIGPKTLTNISSGTNKDSLKEWAKHKLSTFLPFEQWIQYGAGDKSAFGVRTYWQMLETLKEWSEVGYCYEIDVTVINGIQTVKEKWRT